MAKAKERIEARKLRMVGESIGSIRRKLGVSKSSVSLWCSDIVLTKEQQERLIEIDRKGGAVGRARAAISIRNERLGRLAECMKSGMRMVGRMTARDLFIAGIALYWAEGNKKNRRLIFTNSDPEMIKVWISWLKNSLKISKSDIRCCVGINETHRDRIGDVEKYWSKITGISTSNFTKASLKKVKSSKIYENANVHYGTLNIIVRRSTNLNYLMLGLIEGMRGFEAIS